jgi:hypothetical protein
MNNQHNENLHIGSSFDDFLSEEAILEEVTAVATKRVIAWQISEGMSSLKLSKYSTNLICDKLIMILFANFIAKCRDVIINF